MGIVKKIIHYLALACYVLITVYALICLPSLFGYKPLVVLTGSMEPTYKVGSIIYYKKAQKSEINVGDAITFKLSDGSYVSHRVVGLVGDNFLTKGDANNTQDPNPVNISNVVGKDMKTSLPVMGYFVKIIGDNKFVIVLLVLILLAEFAMGYVKEGDDNEARQE